VLRRTRTRHCHIARLGNAARREFISNKILFTPNSTISHHGKNYCNKKKCIYVPKV